MTISINVLESMFNSKVTTVKTACLGYFNPFQVTSVAIISMSQDSSDSLSYAGKYKAIIVPSLPHTGRSLPIRRKGTTMLALLVSIASYIK